MELSFVSTLRKMIGILDLQFVTHFNENTVPQQTYIFLTAYYTLQYSESHYQECLFGII